MQIGIDKDGCEDINKYARIIISIEIDRGIEVRPTPYEINGFYVSVFPYGFFIYLEGAWKCV